VPISPFETWVWMIILLAPPLLAVIYAFRKPKAVS
jgi:hypothetical protein